MNTNLKPCPRCYGNRVTSFLSFQNGWVRCWDCNYEICEEHITRPKDKRESGERRAIKLWNNEIRKGVCNDVKTI